MLRRVARTGDGWFPLFAPDDEGRKLVERMRGYARDAGRDPGNIGIESWFSARNGGPGEWVRFIDAWEDLGATHVSVNTMGAGLGSPDGHIEAIRRFKEAVGGA